MTSAGWRNLVTGGAGFLGSHLIDRLLARGETVVCIDDLSSGSERNIAHLLDHPRFRFVHHDVCEPVQATVDFAGIDRIYNFACPASPIHYQRDPVRTTRTAVLGALNLLELARAHGCRILQASTSEVYGDPLVHPQPEHYWGNVNPVGIRSCYNEGKRCAESLFADHRRQHGTDIRIARIFNTYGPRMDPADGRVVANFIVQALRGDPITLHGDGRQTRSFCYVGDFVDGILRLMDSPPDFAGPVNLGNPVEISMRGLAALVLELTGSSSALAWQAAPPDDPLRRSPDITLARQRLGWVPEVDLADGLRLTIAYFARRLADAERPATSFNRRSSMA